jgi:hypothetical protein
MADSEPVLNDVIPAPNEDPETFDEPYVGNVYAFEATGGFSMERGFDTIKLAEQTAPSHVDVTNAIQIKMNVELFNNKLDLSSFNEETDMFGEDEITITAEDLTADLVDATRVITVGKYETLYSDFQTYVSDYFGFDGGFSSLFVAASEFAIDGNNEFTGASFISLLTGVAADPSGRYISDLSGSITISNIAKLLKYSVDGNVFNNRDPTTTNWGVSDGFVAGDLIWVPEGTTITLTLIIDSEAFLPLNNIGPARQIQNTSFETVNFSHETTASTTLITRVAKAPLLIKLIEV